MLGCGAHREVIDASFTRAHPLRERCWALRMHALYRDGRQARGAAGLPGPARRLQVIGTYRGSELSRDRPLADTLATLRQEGRDRLELVGLEDGDVFALMETAAGHSLDGTFSALARQLRHDTGGNPFFVVELMRHLGEGGVVRREDGRWLIRGSVDRQGMPASLREVVGARVARLGPRAEQVLTQAAVMGRDFHTRVLGAVCGLPEAELVCELERATTAAIVMDVAPGHYSFVHAAIQSTLYDDLHPTRRAVIHRQIAETSRLWTVPAPVRGSPRSPTTGCPPRHRRTSTGRGGTPAGPARQPWPPAPRRRPSAGSPPRSACPARARMAAPVPTSSSSSARPNGWPATPPTARRCSRRPPWPAPSATQTCSCGPRWRTTVARSAPPASWTPSASPRSRTRRPHRPPPRPSGAACWPRSARSCPARRLAEAAGDRAGGHRAGAQPGRPRDPGSRPQPPLLLGARDARRAARHDGGVLGAGGRQRRPDRPALGTPAALLHRRHGPAPPRARGGSEGVR